MPILVVPSLQSVVDSLFVKAFTESAKFNMSILVKPRGFDSLVPAFELAFRHKRVPVISKAPARMFEGLLLLDCPFPGLEQHRQTLVAQVF